MVRSLGTITDGSLIPKWPLFLACLRVAIDIIVYWLLLSLGEFNWPFKVLDDYVQ